MQLVGLSWILILCCIYPCSVESAGKTIRIRSHMYVMCRCIHDQMKPRATWPKYWCMVCYTSPFALVSKVRLKYIGLILTCIFSVLCSNLLLVRLMKFTRSVIPLILCPDPNDEEKCSMTQAWIVGLAVVSVRLENEFCSLSKYDWLYIKSRLSPIIWACVIRLVKEFLLVRLYWVWFRLHLYALSFSDSDI